MTLATDDQGYGSRERSLEPIHEDLTVGKWTFSCFSHLLTV